MVRHDKTMPRLEKNIILLGNIMCYNPDTWHNFPKRNSPVKNCTKEQNAK